MKRLIALALALSLLAVPTAAWAQRKVETETKSGKIKEVQVKGRLKTLVVLLDDGTEQAYPLTPKVQVNVQFEGKEAQVKPGVYVTGQANLTNNQLIVSELTVYDFAPGQKSPPANISPVRPEPPPPGDTPPQTPPMPPTKYDFAGEVLARQPSAQFAEYEQLSLKLPGNVPPILMQKTVPVSYISTDPTQAPAEAEVELEILPGRGEKFTLLKVTIKGGEAPAGETTAK